MHDVRVITFNVEQGLFNLMTGRRDKDNSLYTAVFDCGNLAQCADNAGIDDACNILKEFKTEFTGFDLVVISHQDEDHWRLFPQFFMRLNDCDFLLNTWYCLAFDIVMFTNNACCKFYNTFGPSYKFSINCLGGNPVISLNAEYQIFRDRISDFKFSTKSFGQIDWCISLNRSTNLYQVTMSHLKQFAEYTKSNLSYEQVRSAVIDMIWELQIELSEKELLAKLWIDSYNLLIIDFNTLNDIQQNAVKVTKTIQKLYLGGKDCGFPYQLFELHFSNFANTINKEGAHVQIYPDSNECYINSDYIFQQDIKNPLLRNTGAIYKNATSLVAIVYMKFGECLLFPGDATVHIFFGLRFKLIKYHSPKIKLFIAPHHGSGDTNFAVIQGSRNTKQPLEQLLEVIQPESIYISALKCIFGHPSLRFLTLCTQYCTNLSPEHDVLFGSNDLSTVDQDSDHYIIIEDEGKLITNKAVFSTETDGNLEYNYKMMRRQQAASPKFTQKTIRQLPPDNSFISYGGFHL